MLQTFDAPGGPAFGRVNLPKLREALERLGLDGFVGDRRGFVILPSAKQATKLDLA
jgi:hypothetical protein